MMSYKGEEKMYKKKLLLIYIISIIFNFLKAFLVSG